jgi:nucleoside-diphosphate-sugar epimerase
LLNCQIEGEGGVKTIIVGKNSNLSIHLRNNLKDSISISSRDIASDLNVLFKYKKYKINIIFNNFQPATKLNEMINTEEYIMNSIGITSKILNYCLINNISINKIIYTSSSSVYGSNIFCTETDELKPMNLHASLKVANEKMIEEFCVKNDIDFTITRLFNMYGGDDKFSIISKLISTVRNYNEITIVNHGNAIRDFIHIDDVVDIYEKILEKKDIAVLNVGTGKGSSVKGVIDFLNNYDITINTQNIFRNELKTSTANSKLLNDVLNKESFIKVEDYIKKELNLSKK